MAKLYIFGIGGTGARVVRSLTMLLASGIKTNYEIVPILIDPDRAGGDLNRTVRILREYQNIQKELLGFEKNNFFKNSISTLSEVIAKRGGNPNVIDGFRFELDGVQNEKFKDFIDYDILDQNNKWLTSILFSEKNMDSNLEIGFKGNPNIGSVVLNQFTKSEAFQSFADSFEKDDRIFIVSSIFGGTGAAGFPLLLKNIRNGFLNNKFYAHLQNAVIGAITVQPYFKVVNDDNSEIDSHGFISKTKAALHYYSKNVTGNNTINALYYIGDLAGSTYENNDGGTKQRNDAHFVELSSAIAIVDFAKMDETTTTTNNGKAVNPVYKEFGVKEDKEQIHFVHLADETSNLIRSNLTQYFYFNIFLKNKLQGELNNPFASAYSNKIDRNFIDQAFYKALTEFNKSFRIWLGELKRNKVSFSPFNIELETNPNQEITDIEITTESIFSLVNHVSEKTTWKNNIPGLAKNNYELFIAHLNEAAQEVGDTTTNKRFMGVFSKATQTVINKKLFKS
jgi:hypothetical protein